MIDHNKYSVFLLLENIKSEHCALIINEELTDVAGLLQHNLELNNHRLQITVANRSVINNVIKSIRNLGYRVTTTNDSFQILNTHSPTCANNIENLLIANKGILKASVNYSTFTLNVEYLPNMINSQILRTLVQKIDYNLFLEEKNFKTLKIKTIWAIILSLPVITITIFFMNIPYAHEIIWLFTTPIVLFLGKNIFFNAWEQAKDLSANKETLVAISTGIAYLYSAFKIMYSEFFDYNRLDTHIYFEITSVVITFILIGKLIEEKAKRNNSTTINNLENLLPKTVNIILADGTEKQIAIEDVNVGDLILIKPNEKIAVDGIVVSGSSYVNESIISGENIPVLKIKKKEVFAGTINHKGSFHYNAIKVGKETMLANIIKMIQDAQYSKLSIQKMVDKISGLFVPIICGIAILIFSMWIFVEGKNGINQGLLTAITVLIIACPFILAIAIPTAIFYDTTKDRQKDTSIQDLESFDYIKNVNTIILYNTGTITVGKPRVSQIKWLHENNTYKKILLSIEGKSEHRLAKAVLNYFSKTSKVIIQDFEYITGQGVSGIYKTEKYFIGNEKLLTENNIHIHSSLLQEVERWSNEPTTIVWFANSYSVLAILSISDKIKKKSITAVKQLQKMGINLYMLTGNNKVTTKLIAQQAGIRHYRAELLPQHKAEFINDLQVNGKTIAVVENYLNDNKKTVTTKVNIAMGISNMFIKYSDLTKISQLIKLRKQTLKIINHSMFSESIYHITAIYFAACVLYSFNGFILNAMLAGAAIAIINLTLGNDNILFKRKNKIKNTIKEQLN